MAWRCNGILAQMFNRIATVESCTNVLKKHFNRYIAKPILVAGVFVILILLFLVLHSQSFVQIQHIYMPLQFGLNYIVCQSQV